MSPTENTRVHRLPERARYAQEDIYAILDAGMVCHVAFVTEHGPIAMPTLYARDGDRIVMHGSGVSGLAKNLAKGIRVCVTVTMMDGLVLARSAFHHSMNYRSAMVFGTATLIQDEDEKRRALDRFMDHVTPGRMRSARGPSQKELRATAVLSVKIEEASAKIRSGGPKDDAEDMGVPVWAGVVPLHVSAGEPLPDGAQTAQLEPEIAERVRLLASH